MELTSQEHADIALYRTYDESGNTKAVCHRLRTLKIKALDLEKDAKTDRNKLKELKAMKSGCFCTTADRRIFRQGFYAWYDAFYKKDNTPTTVDPNI